MNKRVIIFISIFLLVFVGGFFTARSLFPASKEVNTTQRYATKTVTRSDIKQGVNLKGQLNGNWGGIISAPRPEGITDSNNAPVTVTYTVEEVFVEPNQFIKKGDNLIRLSANNLVEILEEITTDIQKKQKEIQEVNDSVRDKIDNLSNKINKKVTNINSINPQDGIVLTSPIKGRILDFTQEEGADVKSALIATIVDDSKVKISFKANTYEYPSLVVGQKILLQYRRTIESGNSVIAFEGYYPGKITKLNSNPVPSLDGMTYVHNGEIEADNPGLVQKGMTVSIFTEVEGKPATTLAYSGKVTSFVNEKKVYSTVYSSSDYSTIIATEVYVSDNEFVEKGQMLLKIAGNDVTKAIQQDIDVIKVDYDKIEQLNEQIIRSYQKIDKINELSNQLIVTAPTDGMVSYINQNVGSLINATESSDQWSLQLMDMYNTNEMFINTTASDLDVLYIKQDANVTVTVDALPGETFEGKVLRLDQYTDRDGKTIYNVSIRVGGRDGLRPGMNTNCFVNSGEAFNTLVVPIEAVFEENGVSKVEILQNNEAIIVDIKTGLMNDRYVEVLSGLEEGQLVVTGSTSDLMPSESIPKNDNILPTSKN